MSLIYSSEVSLFFSTVHAQWTIGPILALVSKFRRVRKRAFAVSWSCMDGVVSGSGRHQSSVGTLNCGWSVVRDQFFASAASFDVPDRAARVRWTFSNSAPLCVARHSLYVILILLYQLAWTVLGLTCSHITLRTTSPNQVSSVVAIAHQLVLWMTFDRLPRALCSVLSVLQELFFSPKVAHLTITEGILTYRTCLVQI